MSEERDAREPMLFEVATEVAHRGMRTTELTSNKASLFQGKWPNADG